MQTDSTEPLAQVCLPPMPDAPDPGSDVATRFFVVRDGVSLGGRRLLGIPLSPALRTLAEAQAELEVHRAVWPDASIQRHVREVFPERPK